MKKIDFKRCDDMGVRDVGGYKLNKYFAAYESSGKYNKWCIVHIPTGHSSGYASTLKIAKSMADYLVENYKGKKESNLSSPYVSILMKGWTKKVIKRYRKLFFEEAQS